MAVHIMTHPTDRILTIDLEATCWEDQVAPDGQPQSVHNMEPIEIGCALATRDGVLLDSRSFLVRPTRYPKLSAFCQSLTGITQDMADAAPRFPEAIDTLNHWLGQPADSFIWCSWGNYDRLHMQAQCELNRPEYSRHPSGSGNSDVHIQPVTGYQSCHGVALGYRTFRCN